MLIPDKHKINSLLCQKEVPKKKKIHKEDKEEHGGGSSFSEDKLLEMTVPTFTFHC